MTAKARPKLLVLASTYPRWAGDAEPGFVHELARRLIDDFEVHVITPHAKGALAKETLDGVLIRRYRYAPAAMETLVHGGGIMTNLRRQPWKFALVPSFLLAQWFSVSRMLWGQRPALIHAHWLLPQGIVARLTAGHRLPYVVTSHGADLFALRGAWFARMRRWVTTSAAGITVVSRAMQAKVAEEAPGLPVMVLPMGIDAQSRFTPDPMASRSDSALLFVGRLVEKKGVRHLLEALPDVLARHPAVSLTIAGFGPELPMLKNLAERLGVSACVEFLGAVPQERLTGLYRKAALLVAPFVEASSGDQEGLGLVMAEAMACGCPVVAGDVPAVHDVIDQDTGVLVRAKHHSELADAICVLLTDAPRRARLAEQGRRRVVERYDWPIVAAHYRELLLSAAGSALPRK